MKLLRSQYNNREVINHLKNTFLIVESSQVIIRLRDFDNYIFDISRNNQNNNYHINTWSNKFNCGLPTKNFTTRTEAIKHILRTLKIII